MGQTLTHGIYLPDEGERNCYSGLAANWQILDNSVGTIAEHTSALSGKAPLVHTHTKSDITDFPVYGNTAGTICEGNDFRLSDARTPVAHTHTKSDVTDLFNSANTWSALNSYSNGQIRIKSQSQEIGVNPSSGVIQYLEFADKNDAQHGIVGLWDYASGASEIQMYITDKFKNGAKDSTGTSETTILSFGFKADGSKFLTFSGQVDNSVIPKLNNSYDLGSSSYQWNNLYAKNYYCDGVAWGLDKSNTWTATNSYTGAVLLNSSADVAEQFKQKLPKDVSASNDAMARVNTVIDSAGHYVFVETIGHWASYVAKSITLKYKNDSAKQGAIEFRLYSDGTGIFYPQSPFGCDLGNSYNKWKTLNGINPGALSLPNFSAEFDVSSQIVPPTGESKISINWGKNTFTPSVNGWLSVRIHKATYIKIYRESRASYCFAARVDSADDICVCSPVVAGVEYTIKIQATQFSSGYDHFRLSPCAGNV